MAHSNFSHQFESDGSRSSISDSKKLISKETSPDASLIIPGRSVGQLSLGDSEQQFWRLFPRRGGGGDEFNYPCVNGIYITELHWLDLEALVHGEVVAYLQNGRIFEISSSISDFRTKDGISPGSKPEQVRQRYPGLEAFWLANYRDLASQTRDFAYWVDARRGIAFEFYYDRYLKERRVSRIYVFEPGKNFKWRGCLWNPENWHKLLPYSLQPPSKSGPN